MNYSSIINGKNILITGGTGSFGYQIVKELRQYRPKKIIIFSRDENKQHIMKQELHDEKISKIREKYKIVWEIPMKHLLEMARDRGAFICQSQSLNLWMENPNFKALTAMHFFAWKAGLKTGIYYLRTKAKAAPQKFTIEPTIQEEEENPCEMCSG